MFNKKLTKKFLESLYQKYNHLNSAEDPVWNILNQSNEIDQEIIAFIFALYAFGNIKQIINSLTKIIKVLSPSAFLRITDYDYIMFLEKEFDIKHRFLTHRDFLGLIKILNKLYVENGSIKKIFLTFYNPNDLNLRSSIISFSGYLRNLSEDFNLSSQKTKFLFPSPDNGSPCKRINLFLRWMVRKDNIDLGLWREIKTSQLIIPLDANIYRVARSYKLTRLKSPSWNMAVEITESLKKFDPCDPVKYDFALSHLAIR